jgi:hypothetical protein
MRVRSDSKVDAVEERDMVNSGARGTEDRNFRTEVDCTSIVPIICPIISKYLVPVIYSVRTPGDAVASGSSLVLPRAAVGTREQCSTLHYTGASIVRYAIQGGAQERRRGGEKEGRENGGRDERCRSGCWW